MKRGVKNMQWCRSDYDLFECRCWTKCMPELEVLEWCSPGNLLKEEAEKEVIVTCAWFQSIEVDCVTGMNIESIKILPVFTHSWLQVSGLVKWRGTA
jgi:hypothetical protein